MSKLIGDVSQESKELAEDLEQFEREMDQSKNHTPEEYAQMYVCLAHDWYQLDMNEEGERLLIKAEKACPGYFKNHIFKQMQEDELFDSLVKSLTMEMASILLDIVGDR